MASPIMDTDVLVKPVNVMMQRRFLERQKALAPYFVGSQASQVTQHGGTFTAKWRKHNNLTPTTTPLSELNGNVSFPTRDGATVSITDITATVSKYGDHIVLGEEADLVNLNGQTAELLDVLAIQAGRSLNMLQRNELEDNLTQVYAGNVASDGLVLSTITLAALDLVVNTLNRNDAFPFTPMATGSQNIGTTPLLPSYWAICHPDVAHDVKGLSGFSNVATYAGQVATAPGEFGYVASAGTGVRFLQTSDASIDTGSGGTAGSSVDVRATSGAADLYSTVVIGMNCHGSLGFGFEHIQEIYRAGDPLPAVQVIQNARGSAGSADPLHELGTLGWKSWHAAKVLQSIWGRSIRSAATNLSN